MRVSVTTSEIDVLAAPDPRVFAGLAEEPVDGTDDLLAVARSHAGRRFEAVPARPDDVAVLCYTSGTTGPAKGAMLTHANIATTIALNSQWLGTEPGDVIYGTAPLFHVVGLVLQLAHTLHLAGTLVLPYRTVPEVMLEHLTAYRPRFVVCPPTVYTALMAVPGASAEAFASLDLLYAGGAVLPPAVVDGFQERFGKYVNNGYGLTETAGACVFAIPGRRARVDEATSALSNGVPLPGMDVRIVGDDGSDLPVGERGEILVKGPCVTPGYWRNPAETANAIHDGWLATGDVGLLDDEGMLYVVDRSEGHDHRLGFQGLAGRGRAGTAHSSVGPGGRGGRGGRSVPGRERQGIRDPARRRRGRAGRTGRLVQGAPGDLQVPARGGDRRRSAAHRERQGPQAPAAVSGIPARLSTGCADRLPRGTAVGTTPRNPRDPR